MSHPRRNYEIFGQPMKAKIIEKVGNTYIGMSEGRRVFMIGMAKNAIGTFGGKCCAVIYSDGTEFPVIVPAELYGNDICYECNLRRVLGGLCDRRDIVYAKFEKTCGAVMFTEKDDERKYLVIKNESGHIGFPKGHVEFGETETQSAAREVSEETGLEFVQFGDFREEYTYTTRENTIKTGVFFIGHYDYKDPEIQEDEIVDNWLLSYSEALSKLNFPEDRELLRKADGYITESENNGK